MGGFYAKQSFSFHPELVITYLLSQDFTIDLEEFTAEIFA